ncbi:hypothetical protein MBLNU457_2077t2 [Dothideomycetes sp. NU457]
MNVDNSMLSPHWTALSPVINLGKAAIGIACFSVVLYDLYELYYVTGFDLFKRWFYLKRGRFHGSDFVKARFDHILALATLAIFSLTLVGGFTFLGLMNQTNLGAPPRLSEIVLGVHSATWFEKIDHWLGALFSADQPMAGILQDPGTFFWAQQWYFALLSWCLHLGFESLIRDRITALQTLAYLGISHFSLSLSMCLYFIKMFLTKHQTACKKEGSWLRNILITSLSLLAMVIAVRTHVEDNMNLYMMLVHITSVIPLFMVWAASSRPTIFLLKSVRIPIATEKMDEFEKPRHFQTVCWTALMTHVFGVLAFLSAQKSPTTLFGGLVALGGPHSSTPLSDLYRNGHMQGKGHMERAIIGMQHWCSNLIMHPSSTATIIDCLLTVVALCIYTSASQIRASSILSAAISVRFDKLKSGSNQSAGSRKSSRLSGPSIQTPASTLAPAERPRRSSARQSSVRTSRSRSRGPSVPAEDVISARRSPSRSRTRSVSRSRAAQDEANDGLRMRKGRRDRSRQPGESSDYESALIEGNKIHVPARDPSIKGFEAAALALLFWLFGGVGTASAVVLGAERGDMIW